MSGQALIRRSPNGVSIQAENMDPVKLGEVLARSGFFQDSRDAAQAAVKVMAGAELGFGPVASMTGIYIVKGRVTLSANLMAAAIKAHPRYTYRLKDHTSERCEIDFLEEGEVIGTSTFTLDDARTAGLAGGENYRRFAKNMLFARALSNGAKWYCPDAFGGGPIYTPDELGVEVDGETGEVIDTESLAPPPTSEPDSNGDAPQTSQEPASAPSPAQLPKPLLDELIAAKKAAGLPDTERSHEWVRAQLVAIGVEDVPAGRVTLKTLKGLSEQQASSLLDVFNQMAERWEVQP